MKTIGIVLAGILLLVLVYVAYSKKAEEQQECIDSGGWINEYNCGEYGCTKWTCVK